MRRLWAAAAGVGLVAGVGIAGAAPASAVSAGCSALDGFTFDNASAITSQYAFDERETLAVTWSDLTVHGATVTLQVPSGTVVDSRVGAGTVSYTFASGMTASFRSAVSVGEGHLAVACGAPAASAGEPPPAWVQVYGRAGQEAPCQAGWNPSWQSWAEPITGGWV